MIKSDNQAIIEEYLAHINNKDFPCIAAKAALARQQIKCMVADYMVCPKDDIAILKFLYHFADNYHHSKEFYTFNRHFRQLNIKKAHIILL